MNLRPTAYHLSAVPVTINHRLEPETKQVEENNQVGRFFKKNVQGHYFS